MKKVIFGFLMIFSAIFLLTEVGRAWNGLAFNDIYERLSAFIFFAVGLLFFPRSKSFNERIIFGALAMGVIVLIAPSVINLFVPEQKHSISADNYQGSQVQEKQVFLNQTEMRYPSHVEHDYSPTLRTSPQVQCLICKGNGTVKCTTCDGTGETYRYMSVPRYTPLQPGESSMIKVSRTCIVCSGTGQKMCIYCAGRGYK